ncbi:MAG: DEAD/DEAH box helicase [Magnetococcus sp. YQC-5]
MSEMIGLREYQRQGISDLRAEFDAGAHRAILCFPTGAGKTVTAAAMIRDAMTENQSIFFLVHRQELLHQASRTLASFGIDHGIIASGYPQTDDPIQVAMAPTLVRRLDRIRPPDLLVVDEAHHSLANTWKEIFKAYPGARTVGLTATPQRLDGQGLAELYDALVVGPSVRSLIEQGHLSDFEVYAPPIGISTEGVHTRAGDFAQDELANAIDKPTITGDAVATYMRLAAGKRAIVFCVSIKHSKNVCAAFQSSGINAAHLDGNENRVRREQIVDAFSSGKIQVLCNVDLVSEGFDIPAVEVVIMLRPTQSLGLYLQQAGRAFRPGFEKTSLILDHASNAIRHGLPDEQRDWSLDSKQRRKSANNDDGPTAWRCPECDRVLSARSLVCPCCGHAPERNGRVVAIRDGELEKVDRVALARLRNKRKTGMGLREYARHRGVSSNAVAKAIKSGRIQKEQDGTINQVKADATWDRKRQISGVTIAEYAKHRGVSLTTIYNALYIGLIHREPDGSIDIDDADLSFKNEIEKRTNKTGMSAVEYAKYRGVCEATVRSAWADGRIQREPDGSIDPVKADMSWPRKEKTGMTVSEYAEYRGVSEGQVRRSLKNGLIQQGPGGSIDPVKSDAAWPQKGKAIGVSVAEYAKQCGVSDTHVYNAIRCGLINRESDGSIDPSRADASLSAGDKCKKTGISVYWYAVKRGMTTASVQRAIDSGMIKTEPDGSIDPVKADASWPLNERENNDPSQSSCKTRMSAREYAAHRGVGYDIVKYAIKTGQINIDSDGLIDQDNVDATWSCKNEKAGMTISEYAMHRSVGKSTVCRALKKGTIHKESDGFIDPTKADATWIRL